MKKISIIIALFLLSSCIPDPASMRMEQEIAKEVPVKVEEKKIEEVKKESVVNTPVIQDKKIIAEPISNALSRVTKKPFGIKITPQDSPVQPERFSGYHTGVDFEVNENEQESEVNVYAICRGLVKLKRNVSGYGGTLVQECTLKGEDVTVLYGHLKLSSIEIGEKEILESEERIGILGKGHSKETDGERKHLHLSIHKGKITVLLGYVQDATLLEGWIDPAELLQ